MLYKIILFIISMKRLIYKYCFSYNCVTKYNVHQRRYRDFFLGTRHCSPFDRVHSEKKQVQS